MTILILCFIVDCLHLISHFFGRWGKYIPNRDKKLPFDIKGVEKSLELVKNRTTALRSSPLPHHSPIIMEKLNRTVVIMPFLASDNGAGHSKLGNRLVYLSACFWSFYSEYNHIVAYVKSEKDYNFAKNFSKLPFFDVVLLKDLPKSASLPIASVKTTKLKLSTGERNFDYIFYTESDQVLVMRNHEIYYDYIDKNPRQLVVPHRLMPYPPEIIKGFHGRDMNTNYSRHTWEDVKCCMPRQNCQWDRDSWHHVKSPMVPLVQIFDLQVPLGNSNFLKETYRICDLNENIDSGFECP